MPILAVREGMSLEEVLIHASGYIRSASAGVAEMVRLKLPQAVAP